ncbi:hypothetical protein [Pseudobacteriovorax antillogorgiicola]|uniref:Uncharacterized protein n=1 Tax=Pseudobacteriovorax antillogorgiicola TaxID=1513793 RepID=A0A1Y6B8W2_9BACT|nr:hypothetical protein [Pseudobacteriovorax antillogorgiicola]TCS58557.1 hypothetical protein EDD56_10270 [Pseudobacteriovorax antillogorgiicola]SME97639.1 hypothetical protein SAMN06296036_102373 [Pseudobacteriovorax antillogorgiicola]
MKKQSKSAPSPLPKVMKYGGFLAVFLLLITQDKLSTHLSYPMNLMEYELDPSHCALTALGLLFVYDLSQRR